MTYWPEETEFIQDTIYFGQRYPFGNNFPSESGRYTRVQTGGGEQGCDLMIVLDLEVLPQDLYVPTAFSPNGDGLNDYFYPQTDPESIVQTIDFIRVFDRWGDLVFEAQNVAINDELAGWDGRLRGKMMNPAAFVYTIQYTVVDGEVRTKIGDVILMR